jgi:hypothetical protein
MEKNADDEVVPRPEAHRLPKKGDPDYNFMSVEDFPPVTTNQFRRRFYGCHRNGSYHTNVIWYCGHPCRTTTKALARIPKRKHDVKIPSDEIDAFWGLKAVEAIVWWKILLYQLILLSLPTVF